MKSLLHHINMFLGRFIKTNHPVYGPRIFMQKTWLSKQVDEAMRKRAFGLD